MTRLVVLALAALALAACAKIGTLDQPAPLFGEKAKAHWQAEKAAEAAAKASAPDDKTPEALPPTPSSPPPQ
jgi:hypothetical protein